jgi:hypothetical protein
MAVETAGAQSRSGRLRAGAALARRSGRDRDGCDLGVDGQGMDIDPSPASGREFHPGRSPVRLHGITEAVGHAQHHRLLRRVDCDVDVTVRPDLTPDESIDSPAAL